MTTKHLDIGCGSNPRNPFACDELYGIDIINQEESDFIYEQCNVVLEPLPFKESTFNSVSAYDLLEHIPRFAIINNQTTFPFILLMNEIYRVLKPGGTFYAITPYYPRDEAFVDPTPFIGEQNFEIENVNPTPVITNPQVNNESPTPVITNPTVDYIEVTNPTTPNIVFTTLPSHA